MVWFIIIDVACFIIHLPLSVGAKNEGSYTLLGCRSASFVCAAVTIIRGGGRSTVSS